MRRDLAPPIRMRPRLLGDLAGRAGEAVLRLVLVDRLAKRLQRPLHGIRFHERVGGSGEEHASREGGGNRKAHTQTGERHHGEQQASPHANPPVEVERQPCQILPEKYKGRRRAPLKLQDPLGAIATGLTCQPGCRSYRNLKLASSEVPNGASGVAGLVRVTTEETDTSQDGR